MFGSEFLFPTVDSLSCCSSRFDLSSNTVPSLFSSQTEFVPFLSFSPVPYSDLFSLILERSCTPSQIPQILNSNYSPVIYQTSFACYSPNVNDQHTPVT